jgi:hypothetical protein
MDDPTLAEQLRRTSLDGRGAPDAGPPVLTYQVVAKDPADLVVAKEPAEQELPDSPGVPLLLSLEGEGERVPMVVRTPSKPTSPPNPAATDPPEEQVADPRPGPSTVAGTLGSLAFGGALAAGVWFGLPELGWTPWDLRWTAAGAGAIGVLFVAMVWRWRSRRS